MNQKNINLINNLAKELATNQVKFRFIDTRWQLRGDIDIIVNKKSIQKFESLIKEHNFKRKGFWPPQSRMYKGFHNNELISIGAHVGGYIGGFGGGVGTLGKCLNPNTVPSKEFFYLSSEEQIFILIYKYNSRNNPDKYLKEYSKLLKDPIELNKIYKLCKLAFKKSKKITKQVSNKDPLNQIKIEFTTIQAFKLKLRGKPNKILKRLYKTIKPAPYIAIVGCNGSGKSTTTENLTNKLLQENLEVARVYSGRITFQMLPINWFIQKLKPNKIEGKLNKDPSKKKFAREVRTFNSPVLNNIAPFVYYLEYFLRYFIKIHPKRIFNDLVITDRGFIDLFSSPNMNKTICKSLLKILPKPKHILVWNDLETLTKRRPEFQEKDLEEQLNAYEHVPVKYITKIKTDSPFIINILAKKIEEMI